MKYWPRSPVSGGGRGRKEALGTLGPRGRGGKEEGEEYEDWGPVSISSVSFSSGLKHHLVSNGVDTFLGFCRVVKQTSRGISSQISFGVSLGTRR